ncbi:MAG: ParA family protein, partial [Thermomicrobiales bacterium]
MARRGSTMILLCTHHKGGVGKTELAIHFAGVLRRRGIERTLLIDCDGQASSWSFYLGSRPELSMVCMPKSVDPQLTVIWNPDRVALKKMLDPSAFDNVVLDVDAALADTVQTIVQDHPEHIFVPVNLQAEALLNLEDTLGVIQQLESKTMRQMKVRIVPLGSKLAAVRAEVARIMTHFKTLLHDCTVTSRIRNLERETNQARRERKYIWDSDGCADLENFYDRL